MRKKFIAGNWKMYNDLAETRNFFEEFVPALQKDKEILNAITENKLDVAIFPTAFTLSLALDMAKNVPMIIGAQNASSDFEGAYTGEISPMHIAKAGVTHVVLGHSERRKLFYETNTFLNRKVKCALEQGLKIVFCVGETLEERDAGVTMPMIREEFQVGLAGISAKDIAEKIIIAYEPIWAIGTGRSATPEVAQDVCRSIRKMIYGLYDNEQAANDTIILYGGSVKPENTKFLINQPDIDGLLVGGASVNAFDFMRIVRNSIS